MLLGPLDLHLFSEGTHLRAYERLGAHPVVIGGVEGVHFAVWAPNARRVSVVADFNDWNPIANPMDQAEGSGIWGLFVPEAKPGTRYKFSILPSSGAGTIEKADPYAFETELRPKSASVVAPKDEYQWDDADWLNARDASQGLNAPISVYEVHLGSWRRTNDPESPFLNYREIAHQLVDHVKKHGFTHVELMPVAEHPLDASWGYQVIGYFSPTSRFGTPDDLRYFVDYLHRNGIGVLLDWVPAHFPRDGHGLARFDGTALYEHSDPRQGEHPDWGTLVFNYGRNEVRTFLLSNAVYWLDRFHIDGLRVDAVASMLYLDYSRTRDQWVPNRYGGNENLEAVSFLKSFNEVVHREFPGVLTIAEESTAWPMVSRPTYVGGLGFSIKWNLGWMHDTLFYIRKNPEHRKYHQGVLTFSQLYSYTENFMLPLSHDEVVHGKGTLLSRMPGDWWQQFANIRLLLGYQMGHPGKKLLFMGGEIGQWNEWSEARPIEWGLLDWPMHRAVSRFVGDVNRLYHDEPSLHELDFESDGFEWIDFRDTDQSILAFTRRAKDRDDFLILVYNFTPEPRHGYRIGVPQPGRYRELLNSDSEVYGGSNVGNLGGVSSDAVPFHGQHWSIRLTLPPLAVIVLKPD
jgi:1,4-alpha-glucan branching enzyme